MVLTYLIIAFVLFLVVIFVFQNYKHNEQFVTSRIDGRKYLVSDMEYKQLAADILAMTRKRLVSFCKKMEERHPKDDRIKRLNQKFDPNNIVETEQSSNYTSYSINKGEKMVLCLRSRDGQNRLVKQNILMFVALHELAHICTLSVGHTDEFWNNFEFLLEEAIKYGYYEDVDFNNDNYDYCGIKITDSPLKKR